MKTHYAADWAAAGGPPFTGPVDRALATVGDDASMVGVGFSHEHRTWVVASGHGEIFAEGEPSELIEWMTDYLDALQTEVVA